MLVEFLFYFPQFDYHRFRTKFEEELEDVDGDIEHERKAKVSAWYVVTYKEEYRNKEKGEKAKLLLGFPWIMASLLGEIKRNKVANRQYNNYSHTSYNSIFLDYLSKNIY